MNTPTHVVVNLLALGRCDRKSITFPVIAGALLPDLPIFVLYFVEKVIRQTPERVIWQQSYFSEFWQNWIDLFNSFPLCALGLGVAWWAGSRWGMLFFGSMILHSLGDFPVHNDDGHRHFFPFSEWRFVSPVSYWDPDHYGQIFAWLEVALAIVGCVILWRAYESKVGKVAIALVGALYIPIFLAMTWYWLNA